MLQRVQQRLHNLVPVPQSTVRLDLSPSRLRLPGALSVCPRAVCVHPACSLPERGRASHQTTCQQRTAAAGGPPPACYQPEGASPATLSSMHCNPNGCHSQHTAQYVGSCQHQARPLSVTPSGWAQAPKGRHLKQAYPAGQTTHALTVRTQQTPTLHTNGEPMNPHSRQAWPVAGQQVKQSKQSSLAAAKRDRVTPEERQHNTTQAQRDGRTTVALAAPADEDMQATTVCTDML